LDEKALDLGTHHPAAAEFDQQIGERVIGQQPRDIEMKAQISAAEVDTGHAGARSIVASNDAVYLFSRYFGLCGVPAVGKPIEIVEMPDTAGCTLHRPPDFDYTVCGRILNCIASRFPPRGFFFAPVGLALTPAGVGLSQAARFQGLAAAL
jgi:hypothetical protein